MKNFFDHVKVRTEEFAQRYAAFADWTPVLGAENPAMMVDRLRSVVLKNGLSPIYVIIDEYDNFTNELVVSNRDAEYDAVCGHDNAGGLPARPGWNHAVETAVVEVYADLGYRWFSV